MLYPRSFFPIELGNIRKKKLDELEDLKCASKFKRVQDLPKLSKKASKTSTPWSVEELWQKTFNSETVRLPKNFKREDVINALASQGDGTYGILESLGRLEKGIVFFTKFKMEK